MAIQQYKSSFRTIVGSLLGLNVPNANIADLVNPGANGVATSSGATLIDNITLVPPFTQTWSLLQVSISALLQIQWPATAPYGKLGKILAGMATGLTQTGVAGGLPFSQELQQPPADQSGIATLWDPSADPLPSGPGTNAAAAPALPIAANISLPEPITIDQAEPLGIGLWLLPSLIGGQSWIGAPFSLAITSGNYCITYDDGITPPPSGYS